METLHRTTFFLVFLFSLLSIYRVCAQQQPEIKVTTFSNLPTRLFFFDDFTTLIYHDALLGDVYVSQDEGKNWAKAAGIPSGEALMVIEHPFNNRYAFVITGGTTHYRTDNHGETWRSFNVPIPPAYVANPLSFHSDTNNFGMILYQGTKCEKSSTGWGAICHDETYYTTDAFGSEPKLLLSETSHCDFAHSSKDFKHDAPINLIYCVAFDTSSASTGGMHTLSSSRLFSSEDFFQTDQKIVDLGIGKSARGIIALAIVSKFAVVALKDLSAHGNGEMLLYVSVDARTWAKAEFPHSSSAKLLENAYTIVESTTHSLAVDVLLHPDSTIGTLFMSNSNGTFFVESLKDTNRNDLGYVDYENIYGIEGVGISNIVKNSQDVLGRKTEKQLQTRITFDDGSNWSRIRPPRVDNDGKGISCSPDNVDCSLHLHSVTNPHNFGRVFSSPAPGFVMGVGSIGDHLLPYDQCDTFLSTDGGVTWSMIRKDAHLYEFGDQGSIMVIVNDEDGVDTVRYSSNLGRNWNDLNLGVQLRARALITVPDSTSQKFVLLGQLARKDQTGDGRFAVVFLDFSPMRGRKCTDNDFEKWYARSKDLDECIMGHKQWYKRRKPESDCFIGEEFLDPVGHEENCPCTAMDYECDYNYVRSGDECVPAGPEPIPAGVCEGGTGTYMGSPGFRLIPGNTCEGGVRKDTKVQKDCSQAQAPEGAVTHQKTEFSSEIMTNAYFKDSKTILIRLRDDTVWQSSNEGYTWSQVLPDERFVAIYMHNYAGDRAYLITLSKKVYYTTNAGQTWKSFTAPSVPNTFGAQILHFHPLSDYLIWTGNVDCENNGQNCHAEAHYSTKNGESWNLVETYCRNCVWARDAQLKIDPTEIICESFRDKGGNQRTFSDSNPMGLVGGTKFFKEKTKLFDRVVGFTKFSEFLIVAEYQPSVQSLDLQVSLDGKRFATGVFPSSLQPQNHAYTILESSTNSLFMHVTTSEFPMPYWGSILKSNSNGTYFGVSLENVNRNDQGFVDFEKMINLDGIALVNVIANPTMAIVTGQKTLQTRITHNDGGSWKPLTPPKIDSEGRSYFCTTTSCNLHIHGYTERYDTRATYSSPSSPGLLMAVGNVGETLAPYDESDTFLSRDAGFTWEEVHKDAHLWEFGDSGSILVMADDEEPTDHVLFSTNEGQSWREYIFTQEKIRVRSIVTVPSDTSRKFILLGHYPRSATSSVAIHLDFSSLTRRKCEINADNPGNDDFELFSPSQEREELCLFGRLTQYHRRKRDRECIVGNQPKAEEKVVKNCPCSKVDFECEFNYVRNDNGDCVLAPGETPLSDDDSCPNGEDYWYGRTAYRKIAYSTCEDGIRLDHGATHTCPGISGHGALFWMTVIFVPSALAGLIGYWIYRRSGRARGTIRLPGDYRPPESGIMETLASIPWFIIGVLGIAWERIRDIQIPVLSSYLGNRVDRGYRNVAVDEDAPVLRFEDEE